MTFEELGLCPEILRAIAEVGYTEPTPIQEKAVPRILEGLDVIGCAQTGTGKTAAFVWPILQSLMGGKGLRALIIEPTRELAQQVEENLNDYGKYTGLAHSVVYGGVGLARQQTALKDGVDILVATPGRLLDHMDRGNLFFFDLRYLVLDEADRMTDMGFLPDLKRILKRLPGGKQTLLFSATVPPEIETLARATLWEPVEIVIGERAAPAAGVTHEIFPVRQQTKFDALRKLLETKAPDSALIFTKTKKGADELGKALRECGLPVGILHSDRTQQARELALQRFREGVHRYLVATDIAARGLDIDGITHIINYDVPLYPEDYVHRIGRTARASALGEALTLVAPDEEHRLDAIERFVKAELPRFTLEGEPLPRPARGARMEGEARPGAGRPHGRRPRGSGGRGPRRGGRAGGDRPRASVPQESGAPAEPRAEKPRTPPQQRRPAPADPAAGNAHPGHPAAEASEGAPRKRRRGRRGGRRRRKPGAAAAEGPRAETRAPAPRADAAPRTPSPRRAPPVRAERPRAARPIHQPTIEQPSRLGSFIKRLLGRKKDGV
jgi:superfamily II DNA/RNA helicase